MKGGRGPRVTGKSSSGSHGSRGPMNHSFATVRAEQLCRAEQYGVRLDERDAPSKRGKRL